MDYNNDDQEFNGEDVERIIKSAIVDNLAEVSYKTSKINDWTNSIISDCLKELQSLNRQFKYVITCIIMQKNGAGLDTVASFYWDQSKDGYCKISWQNPTLHAIVTVYGMSVNIDDPNEHEF